MKFRQLRFTNRIKASCILFLGLLAWGCSTSEIIHYEIPPDWRTEELRSKTIFQYSEYLAGKKVFLDPGHGGSDRKNKGKFVFEADLNLNVALALRSYLQKAGAIVYLSRDKDTTIDIRSRPSLVRKTDSDIFISIHHNAPGSPDDNWTNYTSTYYHARETDYEYEPSSRDLARYIQRDLAYVMDNPGGLGSFDGTYSDYIIYPNAGFLVLREADIPAALVECGFFTNPYQEKRLSKQEFNQIQAWGIFRGIAKYFKSGIPEIVSLNEEDYPEGDIVLNYVLKDKSGINPEFIKVYYDSLITYHRYDVKSGKLQVPIYGITAGEHSIRIICANKNNIHAFPFNETILIKPHG